MAQQCGCANANYLPPDVICFRLFGDSHYVSAGSTRRDEGDADVQRASVGESVVECGVSFQSGKVHNRIEEEERRSIVDIVGTSTMRVLVLVDLLFIRQVAEGFSSA